MSKRKSIVVSSEAHLYLTRMKKCIENQFSLKINWTDFVMYLETRKLTAYQRLILSYHPEKRLSEKIKEGEKKCQKQKKK